MTSVCSGGAYGISKCPTCRRTSNRWTHVRPVCRDLVDSPPIPEVIPTGIATPRFEPSVRRALGGICCATCHALSGLFCADRAPNTDQPREKRLRACASQQTVAAAAESSRGTKNRCQRVGVSCSLVTPTPLDDCTGRRLRLLAQAFKPQGLAQLQ